MNSFARAFVVCVLGACGGSQPAQTPPGPPQPAPPPPGPAALDTTQLGQPCGAEGQRCDAPATCVTYYGIAGPRGPAFKSCEVTCAEDAAGCPSGTKCVTIADGPGAVCRPD